MVWLPRYAAIALTAASVAMVGRHLLPLLPLEWGFAIGGLSLLIPLVRWLWSMARACTPDTWITALCFLAGLLGSIAL